MQVREIAVLTTVCMQMMGSLQNYRFHTAWKISEIPIMARAITEFAIFHKRRKLWNWPIFNAEFATVKSGFSVALYAVMPNL